MKIKLKLFFILGLFVTFCNVLAMEEDEWPQDDLSKTLNVIYRGKRWQKFVKANGGYLKDEFEGFHRPFSMAHRSKEYILADELYNYIPKKEVISQKRKAARVLLMCFKRFENGEGVKVAIPKKVQLRLCDYCTPGIAAPILVQYKLNLLSKFHKRDMSGCKEKIEIMVLQELQEAPLRPIRKEECEN